MILFNKLKKPIYLYAYLLLFGVLTGHGAEPNNPSEIIPAGTRMTIPLTVMEQYQAEKGWGMPFNYLSYHYAIPMPSTLIKEEGTYYVPLSYTSKKDKKNKIIMMDLMNVQMDAKYNFTTLRSINVNKTILRSKRKNIKLKDFDFAKDNQIQAVELCSECIFEYFDSNTKNLQKFINMAIAPSYLFSAVISRFCRTCGKVLVNDFINYVEQRAKEENIPSGIFFAIMYKESSGDCNKRNTQKNVEDSIGLFQMNQIGGSTKLKQCPKKKPPNIESKKMKAACYKGKYKTKGNSICNPNYETDKFNKNQVCLNNPYCNFEEALSLLNCKWFTVHKDKCINPIKEVKQVCVPNKTIPPMPRKAWSNMNINEKDLWRQTLMAYNTITYLKEAKKELKVTKKFRTWEIIRMYVHLLCLGNNEGRNPNKGACTNLNYVEKLAGWEREEIKGHSLIENWDQYRKNHKKIHCPKIQTAKIETIRF